MKKIYTCVGLLLLGYTSAQKVAWQRDVKSSTQAILSHVATTLDGQMLVAGSSIQSNGGEQLSTNNHNKGYDYHIIKIDQQGQKLWEKYYSGNQQDYLNFALPSQEGGFLLVGNSNSALLGDKKTKSYGSSDIWVIKIDENGEEEWQQSIGTKNADLGKVAAQSTDLGFWIAGTSSHSELGYGGQDVFLIKLDAKSKIQHQHILGGKGLDEVEHMIATKDGGVLLGVYSKSPQYADVIKPALSEKEFINEARHKVFIKEDLDEIERKKEQYTTDFHSKSSEHYGDGDYWLIKLDRDGRQEWQKSFGGKEDDHIRKLSLTDTGYMISGESRSQTSGTKKTTNKEGTDVWLIAIDEHGNEQWQKSYDFGIRDIVMSLNVINTEDYKTKGFLVGGYTQSEGEKKKNDESFWMLYIDNKGEEVWRKYVEGDSKKNQERLSSVALTRDGSYILAGTSTEELGDENWKIIKLKDSQVEDLLENKNLQTYPNPVKDYCYVEIGVDFTEADLFIYDMTGRLVQQIKTRNKITKLNTANLPQGTYIIKAQTNKQQTQTLTNKIIKE